MVVWAKTADSYVLPSIKLSVTGAGWLSGAAVGSWMVDRELVASTIPGNIRQRTGLSIGAASVTVRPAVRSTPWSKVAGSKVDTGRAATLYAEASDGTTKALGAWVTDETDGSLSAEEIGIDLLEASFVARGLPQTLPACRNEPFTPEMPVDPVWPISRLLEQAGFPAVPQPDPAKTLLAMPMDGAVTPTLEPAGRPGIYSVAGEIAGGWSTMGDRGLVAGGSGSGFTAVASVATGGVPTVERLMAGGTVVFTLDVVGTVYLLDVAQNWLIRVTNDQPSGTYWVSVSNTLGVGSTVATFAGRQSADWPDRVQIEFTRVKSNPLGVVGGGLQWSSATVRARSGPAATWSATRTNTVSTTPTGGAGLEMPQIVGGVAIPGVPGIPSSPAPGRFSAVVVSTDSSDPGLWSPRRAVLKPLGGDAGLPFVPPGVDTWQGIQDAASANLAAVLVDLDGLARVLTKDDLAGTGVAGDPIDVGAEWEDLGWTLDPDDTADRVEVSYTAPSIERANLGSTDLAPVVWQAPEVLEIAPGATATIPVAFENKATVGIFETFIIPGSPSPLWSQTSTAIAFDNPDGTGSPLTSAAFRADAAQTSATTATVRVKNTHTGPIYMVDGNGEPGLILRARLVASYETPQVVARGLAPEKAKRPMTVALTPWVQTAQQAQAIANYLWDRVSGGGLWKAASVKCRLDWSLDIGQVRSLAHARSGLDAKALITKVHYDGTDGSTTQTLDLVLIPWTYADFAAKWPGKTYTQFATAQGPTRTYADHAADPLWTGA